MCEFKEGSSTISSPEKIKLTVSTIERGQYDMREQLKTTEYFETALEETKFGKFNYILVFVSGLILANVLLETLAISFVLPVSQCDLNLSNQDKGILSAIGFAGIISSSHLWGFLADTTGRRNIIRPTLLLGFLLSLLSSFSTNFWMLVIVRYLNGFCISGGSATIYAYLGEFHTSKNRARAIMGAAFIFGVGAMLMPAIAWLVINQEWRLVIPCLGLTYKPWRLFMVVCGIPGFLCGLSLFKIPESPKFLLSQGNEEECLEILRTIYHCNTGRPRSEYPVAHVLEDLDCAKGANTTGRVVNMNPVLALLLSMWHQTQPLFNREFMRTTVLICLIQFWIFVTSNGLYMWFPHILNSVAEYTKEHPGNRTLICDIVAAKQAIMFTLEDTVNVATDTASQIARECNEKLDISTYQHSLVLEILYALGFAFIGTIINKVQKQWILFVCLATCGASGITTVFVDIPMVAIYLYLVLLLCGLGINVLSAATVDLYPTRLRAMAVCISLMAGRLGSVVGANVMGALISNYCKPAFIFAGTSLIVSGILGFLIVKPASLGGKDEPPRRASLVSMTGN